MATDDKAPILVAVVADLHVNSTVGLCPSAVALEKGMHRATKAQRVVFAAWREFWQERVYAKAGAIGAKVYVVIAGDLNDKNIHDRRGAELITTVDADIVKMSMQALEPMLAGKPAHIFIVRGTEAHTGKAANLEEEVAKDLEPKNCGVVWDEQEGACSWWWLKLEAGGVTFDIAHHPETTGLKPWTEDPAAARCAREIRARYLDRGEKPPDVAVRAHIHKYIPSGKRLNPQMFYCPPWQLTGSHPRRYGATSFRAIGGLVFICQNGHYDQDYIPHLWRPPILRKKIWKPS